MSLLGTHSIHFTLFSLFIPHISSAVTRPLPFHPVSDLFLIFYCSLLANYFDWQFLSPPIQSTHPANFLSGWLEFFSNNSHKLSRLVIGTQTASTTVIVPGLRSLLLSGSRGCLSRWRRGSTWCTEFRFFPSKYLLVPGLLSWCRWSLRLSRLSWGRRWSTRTTKIKNDILSISSPYLVGEVCGWVDCIVVCPGEYEVVLGTLNFL